LQDAIKRKDYETLVEEYTRARKYANEQIYVENARTDGFSNGCGIHTIIVTLACGLMLSVRLILRRDAWRSNRHALQQAARRSRGQTRGAHGIIAIMLEIGVEENPIWFLASKSLRLLKNKITATCERSKVEVRFCDAILLTAKALL